MCTFAGKFKTSEQKTDFINRITNRSIYNFGFKPGINDHILTLSTCKKDGRLVVHAMLIDE